MKRAPKRIQRKRVKGWRMPRGAVYVGRPTVFGNPWTLWAGETAEDVVSQFRRWLATPDRYGAWQEQRWQLRDRLHELRGKDLACWCKLGAACHADVLLELSNK